MEGKRAYSSGQTSNGVDDSHKSSSSKCYKDLRDVKPLSTEDLLNKQIPPYNSSLKCFEYVQKLPNVPIKYTSEQSPSTCDPLGLPSESLVRKTPVSSARQSPSKDSPYAAEVVDSKDQSTPKSMLPAFFIDFKEDVIDGFSIISFKSVEHLKAEQLETQEIEGGLGQEAVLISAPEEMKQEPTEPTGPIVMSLMETGLSRDLLLSASRMHACSTCNLRFSTASALKCHEKVHIEKETIVCVFCGQIFNAMSQLNLHMLNDHRDVNSNDEFSNQHHCSECDRFFSTARNLRQHQKLRHLKEGLIECDVTGCGSRFNSNSCLRKHIQRVHLKLRPHACPVCAKRFSDANTLSGHMRVHSGERPHECPICNKRFSESTTLKKHKLTHTGEKPYQCVVCQKRFGQIGHLQTHKKIHTDTKDYQCDQCDQRFRTGSAMRMHALRAHSSERPFRCDFCDKGFVTACKLREHRQRHIARLGASAAGPGSSSAS